MCPKLLEALREQASRTVLLSPVRSFYKNVWLRVIDSNFQLTGEQPNGFSDNSRSHDLQEACAFNSGIAQRASWVVNQRVLSSSPAWGAKPFIDLQARTSFKKQHSSATVGTFVGMLFHNGA